MKHVTYAFLCLLTIVSCSKKDTNPITDVSPNISIDSLKSIVTNLPTADYSDLTFLNATTGFAISQGLIVKTVDGGHSWIQQTAPINGSFSKIQFTNSLTGYIVGGNGNQGYLLKTTNGGDIWTVINLGISQTPNGMYFTNNLTGFITGDNLFIKTTDGGQTWVNINSTIPRTFIDVNFKNEQEGIATSTSGVYFKTTNGGIKWDSVKTVSTTHFNAVYYTSSKTLLKTASDSLFDIATNQFIVKIPNNIYKIIFLSDTKSIAIGSHYEQVGFWPFADIYITNNSWQTCTQKTYTLSDAFTFRAIAKITDNKTMILGLGASGTKVIQLNR